MGEESLEKIILISDNEEKEIKSNLKSFNYIEERLATAVLNHNNPKIAVYVSENSTIEEDELFQHLLDAWQDTQFFVIHKVAQKITDTQKRIRYNEETIERISEFNLDDIESSEGKVEFNSALNNKINPFANSSDIALYMSKKSKEFKAVRKILKDLDVESFTTYENYAELQYQLLREQKPKIVIVGQEDPKNITRLKKDYQGKLIIVAEREQVENIKPNGAITLSLEPKKSFKDSLTETIKLCLEAANKDELAIEMNNHNNHLYIFLGATCSGKSTTIRGIKSKLECITQVIESTTRKPRPGEIDKEDMIFLTKQQFDINKSIKNLFMHTYSVHDNFYGIPNIVIKDMNDGYDVILQTKNSKVVEEIIKSKKIPKEKIIPVLIDASEEIIDTRFLTRKDAFSKKATKKDIQDLQKRYGGLDVEPRDIKDQYEHLVNKYGFLPWVIKNNATPKRAISIGKNIVLYNREFQHDKTFADSITNALFNMNLGELTNLISKNCEIDKNCVDQLVSEYKNLFISQDEVDKFYHLLLPMTNLKVVDIDMTGMYGTIFLETPAKKNKLAEFLATKNLSVKDVLIDLFKCNIGYNPVRENKIETFKNYIAYQDIKIFDRNADSIDEGLVWSVSDSFGENSHKSIKSLAICFYDGTSRPELHTITDEELKDYN